ncbi:MAG: DUF5671 domain-containing protein, partial [Nitriliruptorales bacterium]|nr:DUF5671 domain-containing protein [Nitriliruptorales bacterium]
HELLAREVPFGDGRTGWPDRLFVYVAAAVLLGVSATSLGMLVEDGVGAFYDRLAGLEVVVPGPGLSESLLSSSVVVAITGALWWWYWLRVADRDSGARAWRIYVFLVGIVPGTVAVLAAGGVLVHAVLSWLIGASSEPVQVHFEEVPAAISALAVGAIVWGHHRARLFERDDELPAEGWSHAERIYRYVLAGLLAVTAAAGLSVLFAVGVDAAIPGRTLVDVGGGIRRALSLALTMVLIGVPGWWWTWSSIRGVVDRRPAERSELPRRVLIFALFGVAIVTAISAGGALLFQLLSAALEGELDLQVVEEQRWAIGLLLSAGAVSAYHWHVLTEDRRLAPEEGRERVRLREVVLVSANGQELASELRSTLDVRVTTWTRTDVTSPASAPPAIDDVVSVIDTVEAPRVVVIVDHDGSVEAIPLAD